MSEIAAFKMAKKLLSLASDIEEEISTAKHESGLAKANLSEIEEMSRSVNDMINPEQELDAWVAEKISVAYSCLHSVHKFLKHETVIKSGEHEHEHGHMHEEPEDVIKPGKVDHDEDPEDM